MANRRPREGEREDEQRGDADAPDHRAPCNSEFRMQNAETL
jgi:hypothetical protein